MANMKGLGRRGLKQVPYEKRIGQILRFSAHITPTPYGWDKLRGEVTFNDGKVIKFCFLLAFVWSIIYDGFSLYTCYRAWNNPRETRFAKIRVYYMSYGYMVMTIANTLFLRNYGEHHKCVNALLDYSRSFEKKFGFKDPTKEAMKPLNLVAFLYFFVLTNAVQVFLDPGAYRLVSSLATEPKNLSIWFKIFFFILHLQLNAFKFCSSIFGACFLMYYMYFVPQILERFRFNLPSEMLSNSQGLHRMAVAATQQGRSLLATSDIYVYYNQLRILQSAYTSVFGGWIFMIITYSAVLTSLSAFQAVIFNKIRPAITMLAFGFVVLFVSKNCGKVYETSADVQKTWKGIMNPVWMRRWGQACRPVRVNIGAFFYFDRGICLTLMDVVLNLSVNQIVTYRE